MGQAEQLERGRVPTAPIMPFIEAGMIDNDIDARSTIARTARKWKKQAYAEFDAVDRMLCKLGFTSVWPDPIKDLYYAVNISRPSRVLGAQGERPRKTHCIHGHPMSGTNLYTQPDGRRECKQCRKDRRASHYRREVAHAA